MKNKNAWNTEMTRLQSNVYALANLLSDEEDIDWGELEMLQSELEDAAMEIESALTTVTGAADRVASFIEDSR
jgi:hypothetical protein